MKIEKCLYCLARFKSLRPSHTTCSNPECRALFKRDSFLELRKKRKKSGFYTLYYYNVIKKDVLKMAHRRKMAREYARKLRAKTWKTKI